MLRTVADGTELLAAFDSPSRELEPTAGQALFLLNSDYVQKQLVGSSRLTKRLGAIEDADQARRAAWLAILAPPSTAETRRATAWLASRNAEQRAAACEGSRIRALRRTEFRFNH